jgi:hypothetical protein
VTGLIPLVAGSRESADAEHTIQAEASRSHDGERQEAAEIQRDRFAVVGTLSEELEVMDEAPGDEDVGEGPQGCPPGTETQQDQYGTDRVGDESEEQAWDWAYVQRIREVLGHLGEVGWLFPSMFQKQAEPKDDAQTEEAPIESGRGFPRKVRNGLCRSRGFMRERVAADGFGVGCGTGFHKLMFALSP